MNIEELARRKVDLNATITGCDMCNCYGRSPDYIAKVVLQKIEAQKELYSVEQQIKNYIEQP